MAQLDTGTIAGTVTDQSGGAIPGATIAIRNVETGVTRSLTTNAAGRYEAVALPVGNYEVRASLAGFQTLVRSGITLTVGRNAVVDMALQVGEVAQSVTVTGEASFVETTTATVSNLVDEKRVTDIPLNNRDLTGLAFLQPGVLRAPLDQDIADTSTAGSGSKLSVAGGRATYNVFLLDGVSNADTSGNVASVSGAYEGAETIQEFQIITNNYSAEYSNKPGAIISAVTKSGTNAFHGSLYEFLRNDNLDAAKWEDNAFPGGEKPEFKRNNFGGSLGGPILRDKTFFFASYEGLRERQSRTETAIVPSAGARTGNLGPEGPINPATGTSVWPVNPIMVPYLNLYPIPGQGNSIDQDFNNGTVRIAGPARRPVNDDFGTVKIDHQFASPRAGFLAVTYNTSAATRSNFRVLEAGESVGSESRKHVISARHTSVLSPTLLNEFAFGYTHAKTTTDIPVSGIDWSNVNGRDLRYFNTAESMGFLNPGSEITDVGFGPIPTFFSNKTLTFRDSMTLTLPAHSIKFGAEIVNNRLPILKEPDGANGRYEFDGLENFLRGVPDTFDVSLPAGATALGLTVLDDNKFNLRQNQFGFFIQDNWKVLPSLTLNLGLRYEFQTTLSEERDHLSSFRDFFGNQVTVGGPFFLNPSLRNFSPRIGFAWSPAQGTAIRGGFGMFYVPTGMVEYQYVLGQLAPFLAEGGLVDAVSCAVVNATCINFPNAYTTQTSRLGGSPNYRQIEYDHDPTQMYRWSLTLEREMGNWFVSAGYSGSRGLHLPVTGEANLRRWIGWPETQSAGEKHWGPRAQSTLINPLMNRMTVTWLQGNSYYHGASLNVMRRLTAGLQLQAAYTLSKATDQSVTTGNQTEGFTQPQRTNLLWNMDHWKGRSSFDIRNNFVTNVTYELPRMPLNGIAGVLVNGWQANTIISISDGHAFGIRDTVREQSQRMERADGLRPNLIPGGNNSPVLGGPDKYYDPSQFLPSTCRGSVYCYNTALYNGLPNPNYSPNFPANAGRPDLGFDPGYYGNLGNNTLTGPGLVTADFSINKMFQLTEENRLQFRAEFFNLFNRSNFSLPQVPLLITAFQQSGNLSVPTPDAGRITSTRTSARQIQFGLRFTF
jgi:outer membrane receptor protein involved in Fe transport